MIENLYVLISTTVFGLGFLIWKRSDWKNFTIKTVLFVLFIWGLIKALLNLGII